MCYEQLAVAAVDIKTTRRELEVLSLIVRGYTDREVADLLKFSLASARKHRENLLTKFSANKSVQLIPQFFATSGVAPADSC